jgi:iron complex transport system ATP-binding protein
MSEMCTTLSSRNIDVFYPGTKSGAALANVSVELVPGELTILLGPNGSGKSTLLKSLSRTLRPHVGSVLLGGVNLYLEMSARASSRRIGVVPQDTSVAFDFSVREVVSMGRAPYQPEFSMGAVENETDRAAIDKALMSVDIPLEFGNRVVSNLSGGERQRVSIARALAQETEVLLFDEPSASLDILHETALLSMLKSLAWDEKKVVMASLHDINLASKWADRVIMMKEGGVAAAGTASECMTTDLIRDVYGVRTYRRIDAISGAACFIVLPMGQNNKKLVGCRAHVVSGNGKGARIVAGLVDSGAVVTAGIYFDGESDALISQDLGAAVKCAPVFSMMGDEERESVFAICRASDCVFVASGDYGETNAANLTGVMNASRDGTRVYCDSSLIDLSEKKDVCVEVKDAVLRMRTLDNVTFVNGLNQDPMTAFDCVNGVSPSK